MVNLSLVIPCYNEEKNIDPLFEKLKKLSDLDNRIEIIIVDNGSTDKTNTNILKNELYKKDKIKLLLVEKNVGYGNGIMTGVKAASGNFIAWCHADLQTEPIDVYNAYNKNLNHLEDGNCVVKGLRKNRNVFDSIFTFGMSIFASIMFKMKINDINAQPKLFPKYFLKYIKNAPNDFSLDLYFLVIAKINNYKIIDHDVIMKKRLHGEAKGGGNLKGKIKLIKRTLVYIFKLKNNLWK